jgi:hypothetical protein
MVVKHSLPRTVKQNSGKFFPANLWATSTAAPVFTVCRLEIQQDRLSHSIYCAKHNDNRRRKCSPETGLPSGHFYGKKMLVVL